MKITELSINDAKQLMVIHSRIRYERIDDVKLLHEHMETRGYFRTGGGLIYKNALRDCINGNNPKECIYCGKPLKEGLYIICEACNLRLIARSEGQEFFEKESTDSVEEQEIKEENDDNVRSQAINRGLENSSHMQFSKESFEDTEEVVNEPGPVFPMNFEPDALDESMEDRMALEASFKSAKEEKFYKKKKKIKAKKEKEKAKEDDKLNKAKEKKEEREQRHKEIKDKVGFLKGKAKAIKDASKKDVSIDNKAINSNAVVNAVQENADIEGAINEAKSLNGVNSSSGTMNPKTGNNGKKNKLPLLIACIVLLLLALVVINRGGVTKIQQLVKSQIGKINIGTELNDSKTNQMSEQDNAEADKVTDTEDIEDESPEDVINDTSVDEDKEEAVTDESEEEPDKEPRRAQSVVYEGSVDAFEFLGSSLESVEELLGDSEEVKSKNADVSKRYFTECGILVEVNESDGSICYVDNDGKGNEGVDISIFSITPGTSYKDAKYVFTDLGIDVVDYSEESFMCMFQFQGNTDITYEIDVTADSEGNVSSIAARII